MFIGSQTAYCKNDILLAISMITEIKLHDWLFILLGIDVKGLVGNKQTVEVKVLKNLLV